MSLRMPWGTASTTANLPSCSVCREGAINKLWIKIYAESHFRQKTQKAQHFVTPVKSLRPTLADNFYHLSMSKIYLFADSLYFASHHKDLFENCLPSKREEFRKFYARRFVTCPEQSYELRDGWGLEKNPLFLPLQNKRFYLTSPLSSGWAAGASRSRLVKQQVEKGQVPIQASLNCRRTWASHYAPSATWWSTLKMKMTQRRRATSR